MKIPRIETLISKGDFATSSTWGTTRQQLLSAVRGAEWPPGSGAFTIYPESGKKRGEGIRRIAELYAVEKEARGSPPDEALHLAVFC